MYSSRLSGSGEWCEMEIRVVVLKGGGGGREGEDGRKEVGSGCFFLLTFLGVSPLSKRLEQACAV